MIELKSFKYWFSFQFWSKRFIYYALIIILATTHLLSCYFGYNARWRYGKMHCAQFIQLDDGRNYRYGKLSLHFT